jgi:hypothetical protein
VRGCGSCSSGGHSERKTSTGSPRSFRAAATALILNRRTHRVVVDCAAPSLAPAQLTRHGMYALSSSEQRDAEGASPALGNGRLSITITTPLTGGTAARERRRRGGGRGTRTALLKAAASKPAAAQDATSRDKANAHRPRQLRLIESDTVMVAEVEPRNKLYLPLNASPSSRHAATPQRPRTRSISVAPPSPAVLRLPVSEPGDLEAMAATPQRRTRSISVAPPSQPSSGPPSRRAAQLAMPIAESLVRRLAARLRQRSHRAAPSRARSCSEAGACCAATRRRAVCSH